MTWGLFPSMTLKQVVVMSTFYLSTCHHSLHICIYIFSLVFLFHSFYCFYVIFILLSCFIFLSCTFHWADLSWLTFHYLLYPVWLCMWQIIKNLEPLNLELMRAPHLRQKVSTKVINARDSRMEWIREEKLLTCSWLQVQVSFICK